MQVNSSVTFIQNYLSMNNTKHPGLPKRHSARIIVDEYEQMKREREEEGLCQFCHNQIPLRLMSSHRNVCAFGASFHSFEAEDNQKSRSQEKMGCSTYTQKNARNNYQETPSKLASQRHATRPNYSALSQKKVCNKKVINLESGSIRNLSKTKNQKQSSRKLSSSKNKAQPNSKPLQQKKSPILQKFHKKQPMNRSLLSQEYKQYFGSIGKKKGMSKMKKNVKNLWMEQSNKKKNQYREGEVKREKGKQQREEKLRRLQNQTEKLKKEQEELIRELQKEKKNERKQNTRNASQRNQQKRQPRQQPSGSHHRMPSRPRQNPQLRPNPTRSRPNPRRYPTAHESYYEQIPINHPHRTINFISQTINEQFQMMKQQFQHMNQFFSSFVPFSNNGFVYFERGQTEDYSIDSSTESVGYDPEQQQTGLYNEQIELLPRYPYIKRLGIDDQCAICISSLKHQEIVRRLPCHHVFHCQCIDQWLKRRAVCPVCRDRIGDIGE